MSRNTHHPYLLSRFIAHKNGFVFLLEGLLVAHPSRILKISYRDAEVNMDSRSGWPAHLQVACAPARCIWTLGNLDLTSTAEGMHLGFLICSVLGSGPIGTSVSG